MDRPVQMVHLEDSETFVLGSSSSGKGAAKLGALFSRDLTRDTLAAWVILGANLFAAYAFFNSTPVVLTAFCLDPAIAAPGINLSENF